MIDKIKHPIVQSINNKIIDRPDINTVNLLLDKSATVNFKKQFIVIMDEEEVNFLDFENNLKAYDKRFSFEVNPNNHGIYACVNTKIMDPNIALGKDEFFKAIDNIITPPLY